MIVENLGARPARARLAHHPEVVRRIGRALIVANANHALGSHAHFLRPDRVGLLIVGIHRDPQALLRQPENLGQQLPPILDRFALEVIAKAEVTQHLEKRMVAGGVAHVFEVVVLAAGAHAFLRRRCARITTRIEAEEHVLELVHPRVGKQQRGVLMRHQRTGSDNLVAFGGEKLKEFPAYLGAVHMLSATKNR